MAYSRSPPRSPSSQEDWLSRGPQSIKTYSTSSSRSLSHTSRSQSLASASNRAFSSTNYEGTAHVYFLELKSYLSAVLAQEANEGPHPQRVAARQKLTRLSNLQFHELAMDVYDEVVRRKKNDKFLPFLAVKEEFHPKRNQARQKLATLPVGRFQDLASDVYSELARRYTSFTENVEPEILPPIPQIPPISYIQPSQSTNIIPVKGMISVENLGEDPFKSRSPTEKDYFSNRSTANSNSEIEKIKSDYEYQINMMTSRIQQLQTDISERDDKRGLDKDSSMRSKQKEEQDQKMIHQMEDQYMKLDDKYHQLERDYTQQQEAVRDVKQETKQMLDELKRLAKINDELLSEKEKTDAHLLKLEAELKEWRMKYDKTRIELRSIKASSMIETDQSRNIIKENFLQPSKDGFISQDHVLTYQASMDDLLLSARSSNPAQVINVMKNIVTLCRSITEEIEAQEGSLFPESRNSLYELKTSFSVSLSDLLVAAKYHASGMGISPVSLLDRSAGHLTSVIVDLIKLLGMKPSNDYQDNRSENHNYYGSNILDNNNKQSSIHKNSNAYSLHQDTRSQLDSIGYKQSSNGYLPKQQSELTPDELVKYLKTETDNIVQTIQNLLGALRLTQQNGEVHTIITSIVRIVLTISDLSKATCQSSTAGYAYRQRCEPLLNQLGNCSERLKMIQGKYFVRGATATANVKRDLAKEAYEIAKLTKELINLFESSPAAGN